MPPCRSTANRRTLSVEKLAVVIAVLLLVAPPPYDGGQTAVFAERLRGGDDGGDGRRLAPCPSSSCKCRLTKVGSSVARCRKLPPPGSSSPDIIYTDVFLKGSNISRLPALAFDDFRMQSLDLSGNHLGELNSVHVDAFNGLESTLEVLTLSNCGITTIPTASLSRLCSLRVLRLDANELTDVEAPVFDECGATSLRELYLYRNNIHRIDVLSFVGLSSLEKLSLAENRLETLPAELFAPLTNLTSLDLARNRLQRLSDGWLEGLSRLHWLQLDSNQLSELGADTFRGASSLRAMRVEDNPLTTIARRTFRQIRRLDYLSIDLSSVSPLTRRTLVGLHRLKTLSLGEIGRGNLPDRVFSGLRRLKYLSLSDFAEVLDANAALRPSLFGRRFRFGLLNVWLSPMRQCRCSEPWILSLGSRGTYIHGYCLDERPLSCPAPGKKLAVLHGMSGSKTENNGRRKVKSILPGRRRRRRQR